MSQLRGEKVQLEEELEQCAALRSLAEETLAQSQLKASMDAADASTFATALEAEKAAREEDHARFEVARVALEQYHTEQREEDCLAREEKEEALSGRFEAEQARSAKLERLLAEEQESGISKVRELKTELRNLSGPSSRAESPSQPLLSSLEKGLEEATEAPTQSHAGTPPRHPSAAGEEDYHLEVDSLLWELKRAQAGKNRLEIELDSSNQLRRQATEGLGEALARKSKLEGMLEREQASGRRLQGIIASVGTPYYHIRTLLPYMDV